MSTTKRALLIGCNYSGANQLYGCINDIIQLKGLLIDVYGFAPNEIVMLRDDDPSNMPRKARIVQELQALVAANPTNAVIVYSGHGTQVADTSSEEVDQKDEVIVPCDYQLIRDDELNAILKPYKGSGLALFDCCHSGTILDLSFNGVNATATAATAANGLFCFSGCQDNDLSAETFSEVAGLPQGAMTAGLITVLRRLKYFPAVDTLWTELKKELRNNGFTQVPQLSASVEVSRTTPFPFVNPAAASNAELTALRAQVTSLQLQLHTASAAAAAATTTSTTSASAELTALRAQVASLQQQQTAAAAAAATAAAQIAALQKENATLKTTATTSSATAAAQIATLQKENATLKTTAAAAAATAAAQIATLQKENATLKTTTARIPGLEAQIRSLQLQASQVPVLQRQVRDQQTLLAQIPTLKAQLAALQTQLVAAQRQLAAKK